MTIIFTEKLLLWTVDQDGKNKNANIRTNENEMYTL